MKHRHRLEVGEAAPGQTGSSVVICDRVFVCPQAGPGDPAAMPAATSAIRRWSSGPAAPLGSRAGIAHKAPKPKLGSISDCEF